MAAVPQLERVASSGGSSSGAAFEGVARAAAAAAGLDLYQHHFALPTAGSKSSSSSQVRQCSTLHMVVRAPRGDGTEAFVLALPLDAAAAPRAAALAAAAGAALAGHLRRSGWLAKDTVLLFLDAGCGAEAGAQVGACCVVRLPAKDASLLLRPVCSSAMWQPGPSMRPAHAPQIAATRRRPGWRPTTAAPTSSPSRGRACCSRRWCWRWRAAARRRAAHQAQQSSACTARAASCPTWTCTIS